MTTEGEVTRRAFTNYIKSQFSADITEWIPIQTAKKAQVFGQWVVIYDTGTITIPSNENKVTKWLRGILDVFNTFTFPELLRLANMNKEEKKEEEITVKEENW